jgi:hypothetical protein
MAAMPHPNNVGKKRVLTDINSQKVHMVVEEEIIRGSGKKPHNKLIYLQKLKFEKGSRLEYRFTYYMRGIKGKTSGRWVFGQYSLMIRQKELEYLLKEAKRRNWPGF